MRPPAPDVAVVAPVLVRGDGQGRVMLELTHALAAAGADVTVYAHRLDQAAPENVRFRRLRGPVWPDPFDTMWFAADATRALRNKRHDVVVCAGPCAFPRQRVVYHAHFCFAAWAKLAATPPRAPLYHRAHTRLLAEFERRCVARADVVMAVSQSTLDDLKTAYGVGGGVVVPNGVDVDEFAPVADADRATARATFGLRDEDFVVGFVGEFNTGRKGLLPLLEALDGGEHLVVAGDGPRRHRSTSQRVQYVGIVPAASVLAASDVAVVPSRYEPFSLVALEAAARDVPLIVSDAAGIGEYLNDAALFVDPRPDAIRRAIDEVRSDRSAARERASKAREVAESLRWEVVAPQAAQVVLDAVK